MEPSRSVLPDVNETDRFDTLTKAVAELRRDVGELAGQIIRDRDVLRHHALPRLERNHANLRQSVVALAEHDTEHHHTIAAAFEAAVPAGISLGNSSVDRV